LEALRPRQARALAGRLLRGDQGGAWRLVDDALGAGVGIRQINAQLLTPALRRIGDQWATGEISVGDEHRATVVAQRLIARLGQRFSRPGRKLGTVIVSAAPGDRHGLPTAILADLLRAEGFDVVDLGADTPGADLAEVAAQQDRLVGIGICATSPLSRGAASTLVDVVRGVREATDAPVLIGGRAVSDAIAKRARPDHRSEDADDAVNWFLRMGRRSSGSAGS
jgi:methanogenic corrinoid protein MtbC1